MDTDQIIVSITNGIFGFIMMAWLFSMATTSQSLIDENQLIIDEIMEKSWIHDPEIAFLVGQLEKFPGFSGLQFFTMNNALLTSITANVITYLIVFIQFGGSGSSEK